MADHRQLQFTLELHVQDVEGVVRTVSESRTFEAGDLDAQRAWIREVRLGWPRADIANEHGPTRTASMQILDDMRCPHDNLAHECPLCATA
jgi:hypothetical protein